MGCLTIFSQEIYLEIDNTSGTIYLNVICETFYCLLLLAKQILAIFKSITTVNYVCFDLDMGMYTLQTVDNRGITGESIDYG